MGGRGSSTGTAKYSNENLEKRMNLIISKSGNDGSYNRRVSLSDWENYGKKRTYIKVIETRKNSKRRAEYDFGFVDRETNQYHSGKHNMEKNYNLGGSKF